MYYEREEFATHNLSSSSGEDTIFCPYTVKNFLYKQIYKYI